MFAEQRREKIADFVKTSGTVTVSFLMSEFNASTETIRKDLKFLESEGILRRVHGGAVSQSRTRSFKKRELRTDDNRQKKEELSKKAMEFIENGDVIAIDSGSTAVEFAKVLKESGKSVTAVTHSEEVLEILKDTENVNVIILGGKYDKSERVFFGNLPLEALSKLHFGKAFIFPTAFSLQFGASDFIDDLVQIQKKMVERSDKTFVLADSSKLETSSFFKVCDSSSCEIITDSGVSPEIRALYSENNIKLTSFGEDRK